MGYRAAPAMPVKATTRAKDPLMVLFGKKLSKARSHAALSQAALADLAGLPGIRIQAIAEAMEVPPWYAFQLVRYLQVTEAIVWRSGWQAKQTSAD